MTGEAMQINKDTYPTTITYGDVTDTFTGWAKRLGVTGSTFRSRVHKGYDVEDIFSTERIVRTPSITADGQKVCRKCGELKPLDAYYKKYTAAGTPTYDQCIACERARNASYRTQLRKDVLSAYSVTDPVSCEWCGIEDERVLTLDHPEGDGATHRAECGGTMGTWVRLREEGFPDGYRVLCQNCNWLAYVHDEAA